MSHSSSDSDPDPESVPDPEWEPSPAEFERDLAEIAQTSWQHRLYARSVFYPTLAWNYLLGRVLKVRRWWDQVDSHVIVGARPFRRDVLGLHDVGVRGVVNTCEEYAGPKIEYDRHGIEQLHIPTTDFTHPRLQDIEQAVEFIQRHVQQGDRVYIHCKAGRARSATVAICWLMKYRGLTAEEAQLQLLTARPHVHPQLAQRSVVIQFAEKLKQSADRS